MKQSIKHVQRRNFIELSSDDGPTEMQRRPWTIGEKSSSRSLCGGMELFVPALMVYFLPFCASSPLGFTESLLDLNMDELNGCLVSMEFSPGWTHPFVQFTFLQSASASLYEDIVKYITEKTWLFIKELSRDMHLNVPQSRELLCLPLPQMWAPGNTADCPAPQQPGRTCDSPSGCRPRTEAPLHHPVKTKRTSVCVSVHASEDAKSVPSPESPPFAHIHACPH